MAAPLEPSTLVIDQTTILSLLSALSILILAYLFSLYLLPPSTSPKLRTFFIWHAFDALIHFIFEGSFLYHCFFTHSPAGAVSAFTPPDIFFLNRSDRVYGAAYGGGSPTAKLWQEYAKADRRWGGADLTVVSLELLTVFGAGPLAVWVCELLRRERGKGGRVWWWGTVLATGELYGGFMTFAPEWLSGSVNLDTSNFMYLWVYLIFFNSLWVVLPLWFLYEAYNRTQETFAIANRVQRTAPTLKKSE